MTNYDQQAVLDFWFGSPDLEEYGKERMEWWKKDDAFDADVRSHLLGPYEQAVKGGGDHWIAEAWPALALIILLDQVPRNIFRNSPRAYASDAQARDVAYRIVETGLDQLVPLVMRKFFYMPFEHSENLDDQVFSVKLFGILKSEELLLYAQRHYDVIERFGRFPHRNAILERDSTPEELEFLTQPNSSF